MNLMFAASVPQCPTLASVEYQANKERKIIIMIIDWDTTVTTPGYIGVKRH